MLPYETHLKQFFAVWSITEISGHSKYCQIPKFLKKFHLNIFIVIFESRFSNWLHITHFVHDVTNVIIKCTTFKKTFSSAQILEKCCPVSLLTRLLHYAKLLVHTPSVSDDLMCHNNIHNRDKWKNTLIMFFMSLFLVCHIEPVQADRQVTVSSSPAWLRYSHKTYFRNCSWPPGESPCPTESVFRNVTCLVAPLEVYGGNVTQRDTFDYSNCHFTVMHSAVHYWINP